MAEVVTSETRADFMAARLRIAPEAPAEAQAPEASQEPQVAEDDAAEEPQEDHDEQPDEPKKPKKPLAQRFSEVTAQRRQAEERAAAAEARAAAAEAKARELEGKTAPKEPIDPDLGPKPKPGDYTDAFEYAEDLAEWTAKKALSDSSKAAKEAEAKAEAEKVVKAFRQRVTEAKTQLPDYDDVISSATDLAVTDAVRDAIIESDVGPNILYHLAKNPDFVEKLNASKPSTALRMLGKLEAELEKKPEPKPQEVEKPKRQPLPEPIKPISAGKGTSDTKINSAGEFQGSYAEWKALRAAGKI